MSLLTIVQKFCRRTQLPVPTTVTGSTDDQVLQVWGLLEEEGEDLAKRGAWQSLTFEASFTTVAAQDQGAITSIATNGFDYIKNQTFWDRTNRWIVIGPIEAPEWQSMLAWNISGPRSSFRIVRDHLYIYPAPSAGLDMRFEYVSKNWILDSAGVTYKDSFTADDDNPLLLERLLLMGLRWRWKKEKGLAYQEDFMTYEKQVRDALSRDAGKPVLKMDNAYSQRPVPGVFVPQGSWNL